MTEKKAPTVKKPSLLSNLLTLFVISLVMFGISEVVVRILYKDTTSLFPRYHTKVQYGDYTLRTIRQNSDFTHTSIDGSWRYITNDRGFRNYSNFEYEKPEGTTRIISIGDSHTQGYEVDQDYTYSAVLERYLNSNGVKAEVINTGVSGFSNAEELLLLENELVKYNPDYIVLGFFANDFVDNLKSSFFDLDEDNNLRITDKREHAPGVGIQDIIYEIPGIQWLSENSYFYSLLFNMVWEFAKTMLTNQSIENVADIAVAQETNYSNYETLLAGQLIRKIHQVSNEHGAKLILLDISNLTFEGSPIPSISNELYDFVQYDFDHYVSSNILDEYDDIARIHAPHGLRHISEFTHTMYGVEIGRYILKDVHVEAKNKL